VARAVRAIRSRSCGRRRLKLAGDGETVARGGGRPAPSGGSPEVSQGWPHGHHSAREEHQKKEEGTRTLPGGLERWERRRRSSGSSEAPGSARAGGERGESGAGGIGGGARLLYRVGGRRKGAEAMGGENTGGHH
jgi:hypothetical protein